jgi:CelD/BcsL family acetyltransferase involved in cellulose biosynthesis
MNASKLRDRKRDGKKMGKSERRAEVIGTLKIHKMVDTRVVHQHLLK